MFVRKLLPGADPAWIRVASFTAIIFMVFFSDALLAYWVPIHIQSTFNSSFLMGIIMASSSLVGLFTDILLPQMVKRIATYKLVILTGVASLTFCAFLIGSIFYPVLLVFLFGMASWGVYYELLGFANRQFVSKAVPKELHAGAWAFLFAFRSLAYSIGPFVASISLQFGSALLISIAIFFTVFGYLLILLLGLNKENKQKEEKVKHVNLVSEISHWGTLFHSVWPIVILSLLVGIMDASFWTTGAVFSEKLAERSTFGNFFLTSYTLPSIFMSLVVIKWKPREGKKRKAILAFLFSSVVMSLIGFVNIPALIIILVFISGCLAALTYPLLDAVFTDITERMGKQKLHLMGLSNSSISIAYIIGPIMSGFITTLVGEQETFAVIALISVALCAILYVTTPRKLKLPQEEIQKWK